MIQQELRFVFGHSSERQIGTPTQLIIIILRQPDDVTNLFP